MNILVVEDNYLVAEMLRMAVEDAGFNVVGPAKNLEESSRLAADNQLNGALLDIQLGGTRSFPIARLLRSTGVPFIFVTGYDSSVLPSDLQDAPLMGKPVFGSEITRIAVKNFTPRDGKRQSPPSRHQVSPGRAAQLHDRIAGADRRIATQQRRVDRLQFQGVDPADIQLASDILEQMKKSAEIMRARLRLIEDPSSPSIHETLDGPIDDEIVDLDNPRSVEYWSARLGIRADAMLEIGREVGSSARTILRVLGRQQQTNGRPRKA